MLNLTIAADTLVTFVLVVTRMVTVFVLAPPFGGLLIPFRVRVAIAVGVALVVSPGQQADVPLEVAPLLAAVVYQVLAGGVFGFVLLLLLNAPLIAGALIDNLSGFAVAALFDPLTASTSTPAARLYQLVAMVILFLLDGHLLIVRGVLRSYEAAPLSGVRTDSLESLLGTAVGQLVLASIEIALPLLVALLLAEVVLGLATRAAPQMNVMVVGFAIKSLVFTMGLAVGLPLLVNGTSALFDRGLRWAVTAAGG